MKIVYTDENRRLKDFGELLSSSEFRNFVKAHLSKMSEYSYGMKRVEPYLAKKTFNNFFFNRYGFKIGDKSEHAHGIGNNNMNYVQDLKSGEYIGAIHLNSDMYGGMYCYGTDINKNRVSDTYLIRNTGLKLERTIDVDWNEYGFAKIDKALKLIEEAIECGVLHAGVNGGVMMCKTVPGYEYWEEDTKEDAAADLVKQGQESLLKDAIKERKQAMMLFEKYNNNYLKEFCSDSVMELSNKMVDGKLHVAMRDNFDSSEWMHIISVDNDGALQICDENGVSIFDSAEERGWSERDINFMKYGHPYLKNPEQKLLEYKGIYFDEWTVDEETGGIWAEMCEDHANEFKDLLSYELSDGAVGCCSVYGCDQIGAENDSESHYYVDFEPELIKFTTVAEYEAKKEKDAKQSLKEKIESAEARLPDSSASNSKTKNKEPEI